MSFLDSVFRKRSAGGTVLLVGFGSKGVLDMLRIVYCLLGAKPEVLMVLGIDFNDEVKRLGRRLRGVRSLWPRRIPDGADQGFLRRCQDHPPKVVTACEAEENWMVDEARRESQRRGGSVSVVFESLSSWAGHTPVSRRTAPRLASAFDEPALRIGLLQVPRDPDLRENMRLLGNNYPNRDELGLDGIIVTRRPFDEKASEALDWNLAFGLAVLIGARRYNLVHQGSVGDALAPLARFTQELGGGYIRANFGLERVPLHGWPFRWSPIQRLSRAPLSHLVGSAIAQAVKAAHADGANPDLSWVMTVGIPLDPRSQLWHDNRLPSEAKADAAAQLGLIDFPSNITVIWSSLLAVPQFDNRHAPVPTMILWPSESNPDELIAEVLSKESVLTAARHKRDETSGDRGEDGDKWAPFRSSQNNVLPDPVRH